ncbi:MAG: hypothetical protein RL648_639 [Verrucomicrobiota bacterium]
MRMAKSIGEMLLGQKPLISVEFYPPKDEAGGQQIVEAARELRREVQPDFVSITYGAGGTTRDRTWRYALALREEHGFEVMPHLTCVGASRAELRELLTTYRDAGFRNIMALRGDPPKGAATFTAAPDGLAHASDLVRLIHDEFPEFCSGVAGYPEVHPEAPSAEEDLRHLKTKVEAGAAFVTTQLFYDNRTFLDWLARCRDYGISVPVLPGLMPARSAAQARRFCQHLPEELEEALQQAAEDPVALETIGVDWTVRQIADLMDHGLRAFHLYIMNRSSMALRVVHQLRQLGRL